MSLTFAGQPAARFETSRFGKFGEVSNEQACSIIPENLPNPKAGASFALSKEHLGGAVLLHPSSQRGGARNRADRESEDLTAAQVSNLIAAAAHAHAIGLPFTRMITIHWQSAGVPLAKMVWATGRFVDLLSKAIIRFGSRTAWLWVHECGPRKDGHCHLFAYVPAGFVKRLRKLQMGWLRSITGRPYKIRVIRSEPIGGMLGLELGNPELHNANLWAAIGYVLKGANPEATARFRLALIEPGGRVIGKRCGTSQNIGPKARAAVSA